MSKSENKHNNRDLQMLKEEVSESEYQNAQYEAEKKQKNFSIEWVQSADSTRGFCGAKRTRCGASGLN